MEVKVFEIRDRATMFPAVAIRIEHAHIRERKILRRGGFNLDEVVVMFSHSSDEIRAYRDEYLARQKELGRTAYHAVEYIQNHFEELKDGQVIDVEYILDEVAAPKESEYTASGALAWDPESAL